MNAKHLKTKSDEYVQQFIAKKTNNALLAKSIQHRLDSLA